MAPSALIYFCRSQVLLHVVGGMLSFLLKFSNSDPGGGPLQVRIVRPNKIEFGAILSSVGPAVQCLAGVFI